MPPVDRLRRSPCLPSARLIGCVARRSDILDGNVYDAGSACPRGELRFTPHLDVAIVDVANVGVNNVDVAHANVNNIVSVEPVQTQLNEIHCSCRLSFVL